VNFSEISPWSNPTYLIYDYLASNMLGFNLEKDTGPLSDAQVYGTSGPAPDSQPQMQVSEPAQPSAQESAQPVAQPASVPNVIIKPEINPSARAPSPAVGTMEIPSTGIASNEQKNLLDKMNAARAKIGTSTSVGASGSSGGSGAAGINSTVGSARDRLAKVRAKLQDQNSP
jgi:hypothetical protein